MVRILDIFPKGFDNGTSTHSITLSASDLQSGTNIIEFTNDITWYKWGVGEMLVTQGSASETVSSDVTLVLGTQSSEKFGNKWDGLTDGDGKVTASFDVTDTSQDVTLSLTGYDIDYSDEVGLKLNGQDIGHLSKGF